MTTPFFSSIRSAVCRGVVIAAAVVAASIPSVCRGGVGGIPDIRRGECVGSLFDLESGGRMLPAYTNAEWRITPHVARYESSGMEKHWFTVEWCGAPGTTGILETLTFCLGHVPCNGGRGAYFLPGLFPPSRHAVSNFAPGRISATDPKFGGPGAVVVESSEGWSCAIVTDETVPYADRTGNGVIERVDGVDLFSSVKCNGFVHRGRPQTVGDTWLVFRGGSGDDVLEALPEWFRVVGQVPPPDRDDGVQDGILYSTHPTGNDDECAGDSRGFNGASEYLPFVSALGCNVVWLRPIEDERPYVPRDYYALQKGLGDPEDFWRYVAAAHGLGMKVWRDAVVHGGRNDSPRAKNHPDWLVWNSDGTVDPFWCYDFLQPGWLEYIAEFIRHDTIRYNLDGWRLDAVSGSRKPNWNPSIPYARASLAQLQGALAQTRSIRKALRAANPNGVTVAESHLSVLGTTCDAVYEEWGISQRFLNDMAHGDAETSVNSYRRWLHEKRLASVPGMFFMRYADNHDHVACESRYGRNAATAMMALVSWIDGFPVVLNEHEDGCFEQLREIFRTRTKLPELRRGKSDYLSVGAPSGVFACLRTLPDTASVVLVNFNPCRIQGTVKAPGFAPFDIDMPGYGYAVRRVKGASIEAALGKRPPPILPAADNPVTPPASSEGLSFDIGTPDAPFPVKVELRNAENGWLARGGIAVERKATRGGWRIGIGDCGKRDPKSLKLVVSLPRAQRWFASTADGLFDSPFVVRHPDYDAVDGRRTRGRRMRHGALRWDSETHPFGFTPEFACVGVATGRLALRFSGFSHDCRVQIWDRTGKTPGLTITMTGSTAAAFAADLTVVPPDYLLSARENESGDPRLRPIAGGWRWESGNLRVHILRSGVLAGAWVRRNGIWERKMGECGLFTKTGTGREDNLGRIYQECRQAWEFECPVSFRKDSSGNVTLVFGPGEMRAYDLHSSRMVEPFLCRTTYVFGKDSAFAFETEFMAPGDYSDDAGDFGMRMKFASRLPSSRDAGHEGIPSNCGGVKISDVGFIGTKPTSIRTEKGDNLVLLWHEKGKGEFRGGKNKWHGISVVVDFK